MAVGDTVCSCRIIQYFFKEKRLLNIHARMHARMCVLLSYVNTALLALCVFSRMDFDNFRYHRY